MSDVNNFNLVTDDSGRIRLSGVGSGIDIEAAVEGIMQAKRIPVDRIEAQLDENQTKIDALNQMRGLVSSLQESVRSLYGAVTFGNSGDILSVT